MVKEKQEINEDKKEDIKVVVNGVEFTAPHRVFKTGRKGYGLYGRIKINEYPYRIICNIIEL